LQYQHNLYIAEKVHLVGYNFVVDIRGSIFIRLAVVAFQNREITEYSDKVGPAVRGHPSPRSSILVSIESPGATSY